jgi:hypothetical protein
MTELPPADRHRLPDRREHELLNFEHDGFAYVGGIGRFPNGSIAEIFLNVAKTGQAIETYGRDAAIVASIALQHGVPPETMRRALTRNANGTASGPLGTLLDLLALASG